MNPMVVTVGIVNFLLLGAFYAFTLSAPSLLDAATHLGPAKVGYLIVGGGLWWRAWPWCSTLGIRIRIGERYLHVAAPVLLTGAAFAVTELSRRPCRW